MSGRVTAEGRARCVCEPHGAAGLEGYSRGGVYRFQRLDRDRHGQAYVRVYPTDGYYYETLAPSTFVRFFEVIAESVP